MKVYIRNIKAIWKVYKDGRGFKRSRLSVYKYIFKYTIKYITK